MTLGEATLERSLQDFARVNPFFVKTSQNAESESFLSVAGRSGRYNNIQIDGAVNNDLFGLARQGTPGGQANTQPISLDAVSELQLVVAPYDVRQSGFSGGGINVITRSGANAFSGTGYLYSRNEGLVGSGIDDLPIATFFDRQQGASVGGPLVRNRAFFFANIESQRRETPVGYSLDGSSGVDFGRLADAQRIVQIANSRYGYDVPGGFGEIIRGNPNDKFFARTDVNLSPGHRLSLRHNYVNGTADVGSQSNFRYRFTDNFYLFESATNSTVGQLDSTFGNAVNQARISFQRIRDRRVPRTAPFPQVTIDLEGRVEIRFGTEQFSTANALDQNIIEIHNDLTWVRGRHQFTIGTHNELFKFRNLFIRDNFGVYEFTSPALFEQGLAQSYSYSFSRTSDPRQAAEFWVYQLGFYAGDQWRVRDDLSLTYGVRLDAPVFPDTPAANPLVEQLYARGTDVVPATRNWLPRIGFNYDLSPDLDTRQQVRGGLGLFHGRTPYVWLSNQYGDPHGIQRFPNSAWLVRGPGNTAGFRSERVPHDQAHAYEREGAVCADAERHRLAAVETQLRRVAPEALPFDVLGGEAREAYPTDLDAQRHRLGDRVVRAAQYLVPGQSVVQLRLLASRRGREVAPNLRLVGKARRRGNRGRVRVPRPQVAVVQRGQANTDARSDIRRQTTPAWEVDVHVGEDIVRRETADPVLGPLDLAVQLRECIAGRTRHRRGLVVLRLAIRPLRLDPQAPAEPVAGRQSRQDARGAVVPGLPARARPPVRIRAAGDLREAGVDELVATAGPVVAVPEQRNSRRDVDSDLLAQIETGCRLRRSRAGDQSSRGQGQRAGAEDGPHDAMIVPPG